MMRRRNIPRSGVLFRMAAIVCLSLGIVGAPSSARADPQPPPQIVHLQNVATGSCAVDAWGLPQAGTCGTYAEATWYISWEGWARSGFGNCLSIDPRDPSSVITAPCDIGHRLQQWNYEWADSSSRRLRSLATGQCIGHSPPNYLLQMMDCGSLHARWRPWST